MNIIFSFVFQTYFDYFHFFSQSFGSFDNITIHWANGKRKGDGISQVLEGIHRVSMLSKLHMIQGWGGVGECGRMEKPVGKCTMDAPGLFLIELLVFPCCDSPKLDVICLKY